LLFFLLVIGRLLSMSQIQSSIQERVEVLWLNLPEYGPVAELMDVYFTETGHGIPSSSIAGAVIASRTKPNFVISVLDRTGQCFHVHLQDVCIMCRKFLLDGARTSFVVLTDCLKTVDASKKLFWARTTTYTEISLVPSTYTRIICPVVPFFIPAPGTVAPVISFKAPTEFVPFVIRNLGKKEVKMRTLKFPYCSIQIYGEELNASFEQLIGHKCLLTFCTVVPVPNSDHLIIRSSQSSILAKATCSHFRMREIPV